MMILEIFTTGPAQTHAILLGCPQTHQATIIDAPLDSTPLLLQALKKHALKPQMILLTHSHWDHLADAAQLKKQLQLPIYVHSDDALNLEHPGSDGLPLFFPIKGVTPDDLLVDGQIVKVGNLMLHVLHTPGHSPGGVCFWIPQENLLISGDTLFKGTIGNLSFPTARPQLMWKSLEKLSHLPPETRVIPGHGEETTIGAEKWLKEAERFWGPRI